MSLTLGNADFRICENKSADQLRSNCAADQRLCFGYIDSTIPLLSKSKLSSFLPFSVAVQPGLCRTWSETTKTDFFCRTRSKYILFDLFRITLQSTLPRRYVEPLLIYEFRNEKFYRR